VPHYLIDGYNLLFALPELPSGAWMEKRQSLLVWLNHVRPHGRNTATLVFDSREGLGNREQHGDVEVVYTAGETADDWIIKHVRKTSTPRGAVVVTDDQGIRHMIKGTGARWLSAHDFIASTSNPVKKKSANRSHEFDQITEELKRNWL